MGHMDQIPTGASAGEGDDGSEEVDHRCCSGAGTGADEEKERSTPTRGCEAGPTAERGRHGSTDGGTAAGPMARSWFQDSSPPVVCNFYYFRSS
jgi:hypothetical protein